MDIQNQGSSFNGSMVYQVKILQEVAGVRGCTNLGLLFKVSWSNLSYSLEGIMSESADAVAKVSEW